MTVHVLVKARACSTVWRAFANVFFLLPRWWVMLRFLDTSGFQFCCSLVLFWKERLPDYYRLLCPMMCATCRGEIGLVTCVDKSRDWEF